MTDCVGVKRLLAAATELLIEAQDRLDGDPDVECDDPAEDDDPGGCEHDGREIDDGY